MYNLSSSKKVATLIALSWGLAVFELTAVTFGRSEFMIDSDDGALKPFLERRNMFQHGINKKTTNQAKNSRYSEELEKIRAITEGQCSKMKTNITNSSLGTKQLHTNKSHAEEAAEVIGDAILNRSKDRERSIGSELQQDGGQSATEFDLQQHRIEEASERTTTEGGETSGSEHGLESDDLKELAQVTQPISTPMPVVTGTKNPPRGEEESSLSFRDDEPQPSNATTAEWFKGETENVEKIAEVIQTKADPEDTQINSKTSTTSNVPTVTNNLSPEKLNTATCAMTQVIGENQAQAVAARLRSEHLDFKKAFQNLIQNWNKPKEESKYEDNSWFGSSFWSWCGCCCGDRGKTIS